MMRFQKFAIPFVLATSGFMAACGDDNNDTRADASEAIRQTSDEIENNLESRINALDNELIQSETRLQAVRSGEEQDQMQNQIKELRQELADAHDSLNELRELRGQEWREKRTELENKIDSLSQKSAQLSDQMIASSYRSDIQNQFNERINELQALVNQERSELEYLSEEQSEDFSGEIDKSKQRLSQMEKRIESLNQAKDDSWRGEAQKVSRELSDLRQEITMLDVKIQNALIQDRNQSVQDLEGRIEDLNTRQRDFVEKVDQLEAQAQERARQLLRDLRTDINELRASLEELMTIESRRDWYRRQEEIKSQIDTVENELQKVETMYEMFPKSPQEPNEG